MIPGAEWQQGAARAAPFFLMPAGVSGCSFESLNWFNAWGIGAAYSLSIPPATDGPPMKQILLGAALGVLLATPALAADGAKLYADKTCVACHGKDGRKPLMPEYPKIAGQNARYAERQMLDIKSGARSNGNTAAMKGVMHLVSDAEIKVLAEYLSKLPS